jgi:hypothetical protein
MLRSGPRILLGSGQNLVGGFSVLSYCIHLNLAMSREIIAKGIFRLQARTPLQARSRKLIAKSSLLIANRAFLLAISSLLVTNRTLLVANGALLLTNRALLLANRAVLLIASSLLIAIRALLLAASSLLIANRRLLLPRSFLLFLRSSTRLASLFSISPNIYGLFCRNVGGGTFLAFRM